MRDKRDLDQTDLTLLQLLTENARRPYSDLADAVGLSAPAVSDRIERLQEQGIIRGFTIDIDRRKLQQTTPVLITLEAHPNESAALYEQLGSLAGVEHVFKQSDGTVVVYGNVPESDPIEWLQKAVDLDAVRDINLELIDSYEWTQQFDATAFTLSCELCGNTVKNDGITTTINGRTLAFCCSSCKDNYKKRFNQL